MKIAIFLLCASVLSVGQCSQTWTCNISASPGSTSAIVTWSTAVPATGQVRYGLTTSYGTRTTNVITLSMTHSATISKLQPNTTYYFQAIASDSQAVSLFSVASSFHTQALASSHNVALSWNASTSTNVSGYNLYRSLDQFSWAKLNSGLIGGLVYNDSTVANGSTYYYRATAVDISNLESVPSIAVSAVIPQ